MNERGQDSTKSKLLNNYLTLPMQLQQNALLLFQFPNRDMMQWQFQNQKPPSDHHLVIIQRGKIVKMGKK